METNYKKKIREEVGRARKTILNNGSTGGKNDSVPDLSLSSLMRKSFNDMKTKITGIECEDKYREEENMMRAIREEVAKSVR